MLTPGHHASHSERAVAGIPAGRSTGDPMTMVAHARFDAAFVPKNVNVIAGFHETMASRDEYSSAQVGSSASSGTRRPPA